MQKSLLSLHHVGEAPSIILTLRSISPVLGFPRQLPHHHLQRRALLFHIKVYKVDFHIRARSHQPGVCSKELEIPILILTVLSANTTPISASLSALRLLAKVKIKASQRVRSQCKYHRRRLAMLSSHAITPINHRLHLGTALVGSIQIPTDQNQSGQTSLAPRLIS